MFNLIKLSILAMLLSISSTMPLVALAGSPTISGTPPTQITVGTQYVYTPTASDPDGDKLSFVVQNRPSWLNFSYSSGKLSGTPTSTGVYPDIRIFVKDGSSTVGSAKFTITVQGATPAPSECVRLSWTPATQRTDGTSLADLAAYEIVYGRSPDELVTTFSVNARTTELWIEKSSHGARYAAVRAVDSKNINSKNSNYIRVY